MLWYFHLLPSATVPKSAAPSTDSIIMPPTSYNAYISDDSVSFMSSDSDLVTETSQLRRSRQKHVTMRDLTTFISSICCRVAPVWRWRRQDAPHLELWEYFGPRSKPIGTYSAPVCEHRGWVGQRGQGLGTRHLLEESGLNGQHDPTQRERERKENLK